ncbi:MAG: hypothetical protein K2X26_02670 [Chitinophagaceae bacterium]|nr:hypothetical protein [Chitinophagaceae bacterium]
MASGLSENNSFLNGMKWAFGAILALLIAIAILGSFFNFFQSISLWLNGKKELSYSQQKQLQAETSSTPAYIPVEIKPQPVVAASANTNTITPKIDSAAIKATSKKTGTKKRAAVSTINNSDDTESAETAPQIVSKKVPKQNERVAAYKENTNLKTTALPGVSKNPYSSIRTFTKMELDEFMRQYPSKNADIRFIRFGTITAEMEGLKAQIIQMLQQQGYTNIDKNWRTISEFSAPQEVHFGGAGYNAANFYIPPMQ